MKAIEIHFHPPVGRPPQLVPGDWWNIEEDRSLSVGITRIVPNPFLPASPLPLRQQTGHYAAGTFASVQLVDIQALPGETQPQRSVCGWIPGVTDISGLLGQ